MNKKAFLIIILALVLLPVVTARLSEVMKDTLSSILGVGEDMDLVWVKAGLLIILFLLLSISAKRILRGNRTAAAIIAMIMALIGVRYMPEEWIGWMGVYAMYLAVFLVLLTPYFIGRYLLGAWIFRCGRKWKIFLVLLCYAIAIYAITRAGGVALELETWGILGEALDFISTNRVTMFAMIAVILLIYIIGSGGGAPSGLGEERPRFWSGFGRGGWEAAKRGARGAGWLAGRGARKARAVMRARNIARIRAGRQAPLKKKINLIGKPPSKQGWFARRRAKRQAAQQAAARQAQQRYKPSMRMNVRGESPSKQGWFARRRAAKQAQQRYKSSMRINVRGKPPSKQGWFARIRAARQAARQAKQAAQLKKAGMARRAARRVGEAGWGAARRGARGVGRLAGRGASEVRTGAKDLFTRERAKKAARAAGELVGRGARGAATGAAKTKGAARGVGRLAERGARGAATRAAKTKEYMAKYYMKVEMDFIRKFGARKGKELIRMFRKARKKEGL